MQAILIHGAPVAVVVQVEDAGADPVVLVLVGQQARGGEDAADGMVARGLGVEH